MIVCRGNSKMDIFHRECQKESITDLCRRMVAYMRACDMETEPQSFLTQCSIGKESLADNLLVANSLLHELTGAEIFARDCEGGVHKLPILSCRTDIIKEGGVVAS